MDEPLNSTKFYDFQLTLPHQHLSNILKGKNVKGYPFTNTFPTSASQTRRGDQKVLHCTLHA